MNSPSRLSCAIYKQLGESETYQPVSCILSIPNTYTFCEDPKSLFVYVMFVYFSYICTFRMFRHFNAQISILYKFE